MSDLYETDASVRFFGDALDPDEVTALLGQPPTSSHRKGDTRLRPDGSVFRWRRGLWLRGVERRTPGDLDGQVEEIFAGLTEDFAVWISLSERFEANVFCGLFMRTFNEGITLRPKTLLAIGSRGLELDLDIYGPTDEEQADVP